MESKSFHHTQTYCSWKSWLSQIRIYISLCTEVSIAKPLCFHTTLESSVNIMKTAGSTIYHVRKFLFRAFLTDESLNTPIYIGTVHWYSWQLLDNFTKDADKGVWRFAAFRPFRNFESNILCRPVSEVHLLILQNLVHACSHHAISQNIEKYLLILAEHLSKKEQVHNWSSTDTWFYLV